MKQILLPTDFSDNSWNAIVYAIKLFKDRQCVFHMLNAYTPVIYHVEYVLGYPAQFGLGDAVRTTSQNNLGKQIAKIIETFGNNPKHKFETHARFDTLISAVKDFESNYEIDLVVMGTTGATGAKEVLFGSNTVHVLKSSKCPVLAIPTNFDFEAPHEILFPTDLHVEFKESQLKTLTEIVYDNHGRLNAMHVSAGAQLSIKQQSNKDKLKQVFEHAAFLFHDVNTMELLHAIDQFQIKHKINLLVMINNKHSFFENLFFRNTINQIGFHLNIPLLVIPTGH